MALPILLAEQMQDLRLIRVREELQTFWSRRVCSCGGVQDPGQERRVWSRVGVIL